MTVDYPGAVSTQLWGINDSGQVVGQAFFATEELSFLYDPKKGTFTPLLVNTGLIGINDSGVMVGSQTDTSGNEHGVIFKNGKLTTFSHGGFANTEGRGSGDSGLVTGWAFNVNATDPNNVFITSSIAFIYDPAHNSFTDFFPISNVRSNIAQGINAQNQVVGGTPMFPPNPGPAGPGTYGYLRDTSGAFTLFQVNNGGVSNLPTRGRGINDSGRITGFVSVPPDFQSKGFVGSLSGAPSFQVMVIPDAQLLTVPDPAAVNTFPQGIDKFEHLVGAWDDGEVSHGFIATPSRAASIGPASMEGDLRLSPGAQRDGKLWVAGGYSFTIPGSHLATTLTFSGATLSLPVRCTSNGARVPGGDIVILLADKTFAVPANNSSWFPLDPVTGNSADQSNPVTFQGAVEVSTDDVMARCGAGATTLYLNYGGSFGAVFSALVSSTAPFIGVNARFHYRAPAGNGKVDTNCSNPLDPNAGRSDVCGAGWSSTNSFTF